MKKLLLFALFFSAQLIAAQIGNDTAPVQDSSLTDNVIYNPAGIEVKPEFPGGLEKLHNFFNLNFKLPEGEIVKGKIVAMFIIEKDGSLSDIKILKGSGLTTATEVSRVLQMAPKWIPGMQNGKLVRTLYSVEFPVNNVSIPKRREK